MARSDRRTLARARVFALAAACFAAALAACNALTGLDADYKLKGDSGAGNGGNDGDVTGDGPTTLDGAGPDGGTDSQATDGATDGTTSGRFCDSIDKTNLDFCTDFEEPPDNDAGNPVGWSGVMNNVNATIKVLPTAGLNGGSPGLDVDTSVQNTSRQIWLHKTLPAAKAANQYLHYDFDFDVRRLESPMVTYEALGVLNFTNATPEDHGVAGYVGDIIARLFPQANAVADGATWHHVHLTLDHTTAGTTFNRAITIDGTSVDATANLSTAGPSIITEIRLGIFYTTNEAGRVHVQFDNVVARRR